jgi:hypothetical protein
MSGDAATFPFRDPAASGASAGRRRAGRGRPAGGGAGELALTGAGVRAGALSLVAIVALSAFLVLMAADRPSILAATTHEGYFPHWMAGPLGGLAPWMPRGTTALKYMFTGAVAAMFAGYLIALAYARRLRARWVVAAIVAVHAIFLLSPPLALTDVFNYINYGRMEAVHHLNPYTTIPILEPHSDPSYALSNWHQLLSPYGPLFTLLTFAVVPLGVAASFWALKAVLALTSLATILLVWRCARLLGREPLPAVVLVGLNPVVLVWGLGGDHNDFLMVAFIMLGFYLLLTAGFAGAVPRFAGSAPRFAGAAPRARAGHAAGAPHARGHDERAGFGEARMAPQAQLGAGAALAVAVGIKASAAVLVPVVLARLLRQRRALARVLVGAVVGGAAVAAASVVAFGLHIPDLSTQSKLVTSESVPNLVGLAIGAGGESESLHKVMDVILVVCLLLCCWQAFSRRWPASDRMLTAAGWASVALLVTLSWVLPWYVLWALPLAALSSSRRLRAAVLAISVYLIVVWAPASGLLWHQLRFYPERTPLGRLHERYVRELLN